MADTCSLDNFILFVKPGCPACESIKRQIDRCNRCRDVITVNVNTMNDQEASIFNTYCARRVVPFMVSSSGKTAYGDDIMSRLR